MTTDDNTFQSIPNAMHRIKRIHFIGIGGAGMCGIAEVLHNEGYVISGSDLISNTATKRLEELGIKVFLGHNATQITGADVIVKSTAIEDDNVELIASKTQRIPVVSRAVMLGELMRHRQGIAVSGTHGKTTTTSLIASVLQEGGFDPTFVIGGKLNRFGCNAKLGTGRYLVAEADESDASFLHLLPTMAVVTNIDNDHMETYHNDFERLKLTFLKFLHKLPFYGVVAMCLDDPNVAKVIPMVSRRVITYGFDSKSDVKATKLAHKGQCCEFTVERYGNHGALDIILNLPGKHNVLNTLAAIAIATELGVKDEAILKSLQQFSGIDRRFQVYDSLNFNNGAVTLIDDYGHHPNEIKNTIITVRNVWPDNRLVMLFQPHRYSRMRALFDDFSKVLSEVDTLLLLDVYSAGERKLEGFDSISLCETLQKDYNVTPTYIPSFDRINETLNQILKKGDVLLMQGAGNIGALSKKLVSQFGSES